MNKAQLVKSTLAAVLLLSLCLCIGGCSGFTNDPVRVLGERIFEELPVPPAGYYVSMVTANQESVFGEFQPGDGWLRIYEDGTGEFFYQGITYKVTSDEENLYLNGEQVVCQYVKQKVPYVETVLLLFTDQNTSIGQSMILYAMPDLNH